ncbi:elongation factor G [Candidatus Sumerlaeota bacterium]|nr:elongation factor G [Candidatus Sumerlaeota bacterium]
MKEYTTENVRNVVLLGHSGSGKSTFVEAALYAQKHIERMGKTDEGNLTSDYDPEEVKRRVSINTTLLPVEVGNVKINLLDCAGSRDFIGDIKSAVHVAEGALIFVDAVAGIEVGTEFALEYCDEYGIPVMAFVNKIDKENAEFAKTCDAITEQLGRKAVALAVPIGSQSNLQGVVDIVRMKAVMEKGGKTTYGDVPAEMKDEVTAMREQIVEAAAEGDDALMERFFEQGSLSDEEVARGLKAAFIAKRFIPVFCGSATLGVGVEPVLEFLVNSFPTPFEMPGLAIADGETEKHQPVKTDGPFTAFVYKTFSDDFAGRLTFFKVITGKLSTETPVYNFSRDKGEKISHILVARGKKHEEVAHIQAGDIGMVAKLNVTGTNDTLGETKTKTPLFVPTRMPQRPVKAAIRAKSKQDEDKISSGIHALIEQDPTLALTRDSETRQTLLEGMGDQHLDVAIQRLRSKSKVEIEMIEPKTRYRETVTKTAEGQYRHKKQSGGRGQFGEVFLRVSPASEGEEYEFKWSVFGGAIPTNYQSAVDKGAHAACDKGILAGYRVVNVCVDCFDGKHHPVDSSDMAFQIAASMGFQQIAAQAGPIILEPICIVTTTVPEQHMGDVMGDFSQRRGKIQGSDNVGKKVTVRALVPEAELQNYAQNLRSMTGGRGVYEREFSHYEPVPREIQDKIIEEHKRAKEEGE